jgi:nicotinate phosphoribosyltransferase
MDDMLTPLLTDFYQFTMAYGYWDIGRHNDIATFELFFRKCPFGGEYAIFCGLNDVIDYIENYKFSIGIIEVIEESDILKCCKRKEEFCEYLMSIDCKDIQVRAIQEGSVVFPRVPLVSITGPVAILSLLETPLLNLINYATLVATNASRMRVQEPSAVLIDMGLRRAQGPNGALTASKYSYIGGFDGTSNVEAGTRYNIPLMGTNAHSWVNSCTPDYVKTMIKGIELDGTNLWEKSMEYRKKYGWLNTNESELCSFIQYAVAFPNTMLALVDTYNTLESGIPNFIAIALVLYDLGYTPVGIRLDSGDLAYLSKVANKLFNKMAKNTGNINFCSLKIVASNDINEDVLAELNTQSHNIDVFGIGTNLVTCQKQPSLGGVYKMVSIRKDKEHDACPTLKLSEQISKITIPGSKNVYRLYDGNNRPIIDLMTSYEEREPGTDIYGDDDEPKPIRCFHPFDRKRVDVIPTVIEPLLKTYWDGKRCIHKEAITAIKKHVEKEIDMLRNDHKRKTNPTPYKVSLSHDLHKLMNRMIDQESPVVLIE